MNELIVLSDIHGNLSALRAVVKDFQTNYSPDALILLGDLIDYGMRSNEVISEIKKLERQYQVVCNLWGNHEVAVMCPEEHLCRFSSDRGRAMLAYTQKKLSADSIAYLQTGMESGGRKVITLGNKRILCLHGDWTDPYWGKMDNTNLSGINYAAYDYVFSGHTHIPHHLEVFYEIDFPELRNRKKTVFFNPGSVGQPRNHNPRAQYLYVNLVEERYLHNSVEYDIAEEQSLYTEETDVFYRDRLSKGI